LRASLGGAATHNAFSIGTLPKYQRRGYSPECQSVLSAKCLTEHSSMSSEYPAGGRRPE
jgi:hypothetical protein